MPIAVLGGEMHISTVGGSKGIRFPISSEFMQQGGPSPSGQWIPCIPIPHTEPRNCHIRPEPSSLQGPDSFNTKVISEIDGKRPSIHPEFSE